MSTEQEHEVVPVIRDWLAATRDVDIPPGLSREDARRRAPTFLAALASGTVVPDQVEVDDDVKDVLWASVEELDEEPLDQRISEKCDRFYALVAALSPESDPFGERAEILHRLARIGWRSAPGGLHAVLKARAAVWEHGNEHHHREICRSANQIQERIRALARQQAPEVSEIREISARLLKLASIYPSLVATAAVEMAALLATKDCRIGWLDEREYLKAVTALAAGMAARQLGRWDSALSEYGRAASAFRRTAETGDLDRVEVEHLALQLVRRNYAAVTDYATTRINTLAFPRNRIKSQLILASALIDCGQSEEATPLLEDVQRNPTIKKEPALEAWSFTLLGTARSYMGQSAEAIASFGSAGEILNRFYHPLQAAHLAGSIGEYFGTIGKLVESVILYRKALGMYREIGQPQQVGYLSVLISELLVLLGRSSDAEQELLGALPLIERFDLREEAIAAVALLREALANRRTDVTTIQELRDQLRKGLL